MKKILVISDTHGFSENMEQAVRKNSDVDFILHLGDAGEPERALAARIPCGVRFLKGNNDWYARLPERVVIPLSGHRILAVHGHLFQVEYGVDRLLQATKTLKCDIALFGHTHKPLALERDGCVLLNPGSLTYPRQKGREPSYIRLLIGDGGLVEYGVYYLRNTGLSGPFKAGKNS